MLKKAAACLAVVLTGLVLVAAPASAADYPVSYFGPTVKPKSGGEAGPVHGATWARGTITWYGRGVHLEGELRIAPGSGCRRVSATTYTDDNDYGLGKRSTSLKCAEGVHKFVLDVPADRPGGAGLVWICLGDDALKSIACGGDYGRGDGVG
ncbi:hypothetical protein [Pseudonocardia sp. TRM90224]|uniref:hypothetical protein n=1 Tax=Pseudonocardia sp. TRM90224 TaxID=2812678 RepID=UPI001E4CAA00|nr:hypothetical protein [Pseudonocardia sp. TRM90224]